MIVYDRLWAAIKRQGVSQHCLPQEYKSSGGQLDRAYTLNQLCKMLHCRVEDIVEYIEDK